MKARTVNMFDIWTTEGQLVGTSFTRQQVIEYVHRIQRNQPTLIGQRMISEEHKGQTPLWSRANEWVRTTTSSVPTATSTAT